MIGLSFEKNMENRLYADFDQGGLNLAKTVFSSKKGGKIPPCRTTMIKLGVNIDHVATLRQARLTEYPCPIKAALIAQLAGADNITCHLREDLRHIQKKDVIDILNAISIPLNFEMAARDDMFEMAQSIDAHTITIVPEKREELTTEHGLNVKTLSDKNLKAMQKLKNKAVNVSLFVDASNNTIDQCLDLGINDLEFHTGFYTDEKNISEKQKLFNGIIKALEYANKKNVSCHLGHGLHLNNIEEFLSHADLINSVQIGHAIVAHAVFVGFEQAVKDYKKALSGHLKK